MEVLVRNRGKLVPQRRLLQEVWGPAYSDETHYLRVFLAQIRRRLEPDPSHPRYFITEAGLGVRFILGEDGTVQGSGPAGGGGTGSTPASGTPAGGAAGAA